MKKNLLLILLSLSIYVQSQSDFRKGYIVKLNNDTIIGLIDYRSNKENAKQCYFKHSFNSEIIRFNPSEIKGYRFENSKKYISSHLITNQLSDVVFFEQLIDGFVDLYYYRDSDNEEIFYLSSSKLGADYLQNTSVIEKIDGIEYEHENKEYLTTLFHYFEKNAQLKTKLEKEKLPYTQKSISKIVEQYNQLLYPDSVCVSYHNYTSKSSFSWGAVIGASIQSLAANEYMMKEETWLRNSDFKSTVVPQIGLFARLNLPEVNERFSVQYDLVYNQFQIESHHQSKFIGYPVKRDAVIKNKGLDNTLQLFYISPKAKYRMQLHGGIFGNWFFNTEYKVFNQQLNYLGEVSYSYEYTKSPFQNIDLGFVIGVGTSFKCLNKELLIDLSYKHNLSYNKGGTKLRNLVLDGISLKAYWPLGK